MPDERRTLEVGRIIKAQALKGHVIVDLWTDRLERLEPGSQLISPRGELTVVTAHPHQNRFLVKFAQISTRDEAESWRGVVLSAEPLDTDEDVIWIDDLFGAAVFDHTGTLRGVVSDVEANPASDLLVLDTGFLIPLTFVTRVVAHERIDVEVPDGLFEVE